MWDLIATLPGKLASLGAALALVIAGLRGPPPGSAPQRVSLTPPFRLEFGFDSWTRGERRAEAYRRAAAYRASRQGKEGDE